MKKNTPKKRTLKRFFSSILLLTSLFSIGQIPQNGLVASFPFDGNANEEITQNNGFIQGGVTPTKDRFDEDDKALLFDGSTGFVFINRDTNISQTQAISISLWLKPNYIAESGWTTILSKWQPQAPPANGKGYYLGINNAEDKKIRWNTGSVNSDTKSLTVNEWNHLVVTYSIQSMNVYLNNNLETSIPGVDTIESNFMGILIGKIGQQLSLDSLYNGAMDELLIYNRALNADDVNSIFNDFLISNTANHLKEDDLKIFPNPVKEFLFFENLNGTFLNADVFIYDAIGRLLAKEKIINYSASIDLSSLQNGVYFIQVINTSQIVLSEKIIKNAY